MDIFKLTTIDCNLDEYINKINDFFHLDNRKIKFTEIESLTKPIIAYCRATFLDGPNKGNKCSRKIEILPECYYCIIHQRNKFYDENIAQGKRFCRNFTRGCNIELTDKPESIKTCESCQNKKKKDIIFCSHINENNLKCTFKAQPQEKYCKKHERDKYRDEEKETGKKYCDISRGCFNELKDGFSKCDTCREKSRINENKRLDKRRQDFSKLKESNTDERVCCSCGVKYNKFINRHGVESTKCQTCYNFQKNLEDKRLLTRNKKVEAKKYPNTYFESYKRDAKKRNYVFDLAFDDFSKLINDKCYYCDYYNENEANGIDRINNDVGYVKSNCVSCCKLCNLMKWYYHPAFFVEKAKIISGVKKINNNFTNKWKIYYTDTKNNDYQTYLNINLRLKRNVVFNISKEEWNDLIFEPCYLCGYKSKAGNCLDRVNNEIREYSVDNCKSCCTSCNFMKRNFKMNEFKNKLQQIATKWKDTTELEKIPKFSNPYRKNFDVDNSDCDSDAVSDLIGELSDLDNLSDNYD